MWKYRTSPRVDRFGTNRYMYKRLYNQKRLEYKARTGRLKGKLLDSGFYEDQTWGALSKAWLAYTISCKHDDWERRKYYATVIQKLQKELGLKQYEFEEMQEVAADFLDENQDEPNIHDMSIEEIEELMRNSDSDFWQSVRG